MTDLANNPQGGANAPAEQELANAETQEQTTETEIENEDGEQPQPQDDDSEDVEHEGKKFRAPKGVKSALMMHADYTRKTQEVAETRRTLEERQTQLQQQAQAQQEHLQDFARVTALNERIAEFEKVDWQAIQQSNPGEAQSLWMAYQQTLIARGKAAGELQAKVTKAQQDRAAATAKQKSELAASLVRDIPGYSPDVAGKMKDYAIREFGFTPQEVDGALDPRIHRLLHRAYARDEAHTKAAKEAAAKKTAETAEGLKPLPKVGSTAHAARISTTDRRSDKMTDDEWFKAENERLNRLRQRQQKRA